MSHESDLQRMLADHEGNLYDPAFRGVLHDALLDCGRDQEACLLAGPEADGLVLHKDQLMLPHEVMATPLWNAVRLECLRTAGTDASRLVDVATGCQPLGSVRFDRHSKADRSFPAAGLLAYLRKTRLEGLPTSLDRLADGARAFCHERSMEKLRRDGYVVERPGTLTLTSAYSCCAAVALSVRWAHAFHGEEVSKLFPAAREAKGMVYRVYRLPVCEGTIDAWEHGYYLVRVDRSAGGPYLSLHGDGYSTLYHRVEDIRNYVRRAGWFQEAHS